MEATRAAQELQPPSTALTRPDVEGFVAEVQARLRESERRQQELRATVEWLEMRQHRRETVQTALIWVIAALGLCAVAALPVGIVGLVLAARH